MRTALFLYSIEHHIFTHRLRSTSISLILIPSFSHLSEFMFSSRSLHVVCMPLAICLSLFELLRSFFIVQEVYKQLVFTNLHVLTIEFYCFGNYDVYIVVWLWQVHGVSCHILYKYMVLPFLSPVLIINVAKLHWLSCNIVNQLLTIQQYCNFYILMWAAFCEFIADDKHHFKYGISYHQ